jgi:N-acetyl-anhydromuramyl-L-alanine amidase AmpD
MKRRLMKMAVNKPAINKKITKVNFSDSNRGNGQIKYLVKHYVGATGGAEANCNYFYNTYRGASAHFFVGHNGEIWQCVEENDTAWHCGASSYKHKECRNSNSIGVELCVKKDKDGKWYYTEETKKAAVQLFAYLMDKYGIDVDHVLRHYDVTGKVCGEPDVRQGNKVWSQFKKDIVASVNGTKEETKKEETKKESTNTDGSFLVQTTCDMLNIRAGAGTNFKKVGAISETASQKKKYTIVETKNGWGKLKSGKGWICLAYTKRV